MLACANPDSSDPGGSNVTISQGGSSSTQMIETPTKDAYSWSECERYFVSDQNDFGVSVPVECQQFFLDKGRDPEFNDLELFLKEEVEQQTFCQMQY